MPSSLQSIWNDALGFALYYPLFMSWLWMAGASVFWWQNERGAPPANKPVRRPDTPPVSVLIPCYNEGDNAEETITAALSLDYPDFEVIAINDGSRDNTGAVLDRLAAHHPALRVVHLAQNQGKAMALQAGALLARNDILISIDGDALLDPHCAHWMAKHFVDDPGVAAVTGNPRIRNRSTLLGRLQVGEFSSIVGLIKRAQKTFGALFTVSGVITAFRRPAVHSVGYWSADMLTEDIDITWKLQRAGWRVKFEPHALVWILMPETLRGLWKQRLRWAKGGAQVLLKNFGVFGHLSQSQMWPLLLEMCASVLWAYQMLLLVILWPLSMLFPQLGLGSTDAPFIPGNGGLLLAATCLVQFAFSMWLDSRYDRGLGKYYYWIIWYPLAYWIISTAATIAAYPAVLSQRPGHRARWVSPDRGVRPPGGFGC